MSESSKTQINFDSFNTISKEEWLEKIIIDLKGKDIDSLYNSYDENIRIDAFASAEDIDNHFAPLSSYRQGWDIALGFRPMDSSTLNATIMEALANGVEAVRITSYTVHSIAAHYEGVMSEMIYNDIKLNNPADIPLLIDHLTNKGGNQLRGCFNLPHDIELDSENNRNNIQLYNVEIKDGSNKADLLIAGFKKLVDLLENGKKPNEIRLEVLATENLLHNILTIRAAKMILANILDHFKYPFEAPFVFFNAEDLLLGKGEEELLIAATNLAVSGAIGGADMISLIPFSEETNENARLGVNIQHVLKYESNLDKVIDPLYGSFLIEKTSREIATFVWDRL